MTDEELEESIYYVMVEMGWLFPTDEKGVEMAERMMETEDLPSLPEELKEKLLEKLRKAIQDGGI